MIIKAGMKEMVGRTPPINRRHLSFYMLIFVIIPVITYLVGRFVDRELDLPMFPPFPWNIFLGLIVFVLGLTTGIKSTRLLYRLGEGLPWGEAHESSRTRKLVTDGLYAYTRNPMVLGYSLLPCGMGIVFRSIGMATSITIIVLAVNVAIVKFKEEPHLEERFGEAYQDYKKRTPFLLPRDPLFIKYLLASLVKREHNDGKIA
jgi:protein-S-isoprenylcysteine O-methyltransferase Ste14